MNAVYLTTFHQNIFFQTRKIAWEDFFWKFKNKNLSRIYFFNIF